MRQKEMKEQREAHVLERHEKCMCLSCAFAEGYLQCASEVTPILAALKEVTIRITEFISKLEEE